MAVGALLPATPLTRSYRRYFVAGFSPTKTNALGMHPRCSRRTAKGCAPALVPYGP